MSIYLLVLIVNISANFLSFDYISSLLSTLFSLPNFTCLCLKRIYIYIFSRATCASRSYSKTFSCVCAGRALFAFVT